MAETFPFERIESKDAIQLTSEDALSRFERHGFLWIRLPPCKKEPEVLSILRQEDPNYLQRKWSVENTGDCANEAELSVSAVLAKSNQCERFYVSTILSKRNDGLEKLLKQLLKPYLEGTTPPLLGDSQHTGGAWMFLGRNCVKKKETPATKKRKRNALMGRAEHTDDVQHSGTWHVQLQGGKTWFLRPNPDSEDWPETVPNLRQYLDQPSVKESDGGQVRLCCQVEEGDLFVLNTKAWFHRTELPVDNQSWSISIARDFNLPILPYFCPSDVAEGEVILQEDEIPDRFPTAEENQEPNCAMAEVSLEEENDDEDDEAATSIVVVALRNVAKGEPLLLQKVEEEEDSEDEEENAPESIDPRVIAKADWKQGELVLSGEAIPEDLPLSHEANCRLVEKNGELSLQSVRPIARGEVFTIAPEQGDDLEEYEEVEVVGNGEMKRNASS